MDAPAFDGTLYTETKFDRRLLDRFYDSVLKPSFRPAELEPLNVIRGEYLGDDRGPGVILVRGDEPVAGVLAGYNAASGLLLIGYLAVLQTARGGGTGSTVFESALRMWEKRFRPLAIIAEIDDPRFHEASEAVGDPAKRLRFYGRHGFRLVEMPYFQPALEEGGSRAYDMLLVARSAHDSVPGAALVGFLTGYLTMGEGPAALSDPVARDLLRWAAGRAGRVPIVPIERYTDLPRLQPAARPCAGGRNG